MISVIEGKVEEIGDNYVTVSAGGVGYTLTVVPKILPILLKSEGSVKLHVFSRINLREGAFDFVAGEATGEANVFQPTMSLLMEAMRRQDEALRAG